MHLDLFAFSILLKHRVQVNKNEVVDNTEEKIDSIIALTTHSRKGLVK